MDVIRDSIESRANEVCREPEELNPMVVYLHSASYATKPVSYTHLDVYKRQGVNHAGSVILAEPLDLSKEGYLRLTEEEGLNFVGGFSTLAQFLQEQRKDRHTEEVEAESISYAVCKYCLLYTSRCV